MAVDRTIRVESVADRVCAVLRERILTGELARGQRLLQEALAAELGISRTPLREALRRLAAEGLVRLEPNHGASVADHDFRDLSDSWSARRVIEPGAARLAAAASSPQAIARMRAAIAHQRDAGDDVAVSMAANREFHMALVSAAGNTHLTHFAELLWVARVSVVIYTAQVAELGVMAEWAAEHEAIVAAIEGGDGATAERLAREHIDRYPVPVTARAFDPVVGLG
ncbi:MAG TPA: GntR family transcriptional regulator [Gaiellales bacterium]|nr:GntR family transcriptional regulator [Gaiellales bacterium]